MDQEVLQQYFPLETVIQGSLQIYQELLGLKFSEIEENVEKWHEEVKLVRALNFLHLFSYVLICIEECSLQADMLESRLAGGVPPVTSVAQFLAF